MINFTRPVRSLIRWRDVQAILLRYGFGILIDQKDIQGVRRILQERFRIRIGDMDGRPPQERVRLMLEELGPTYVKLGQILSSRDDLFGPDWTAEFSKLQDSVPPFTLDQVHKVIQEEFGKPVEEIFLEFSGEPIAAASLGQVHKAILLNSQPVMVKVQRPDIRQQIDSDMEIIRQIARQAENRTALGKRFRLIAVVEEFSRAINEELDYRNEAANADRLRKNMMNLSCVHVPHVYWEYVTERILTMEAIEGIKINDLLALDAARINRSEIADTLIHSIFQQLLIDGFYHADPHPGNLLVHPETGVLNYIDLGMMGSLLPEQRQALGDLVTAILNRDSLEIVRLFLSLGDTLQPINEYRMRRSIDHILHRYLEASLERISFSRLLSETLITIYQNGIQLPGELALAIKTLIQGEDVALRLDPDLAILDICKTVSQQLLWQRLNPQNLLLGAAGSLRETLRLARSLPRAAEILLKQIEDGALRIGLDIPDFSRTVNHAYVITNRLAAGVIIAGMIIGSSFVMAVSPSDSWIFIPILGVIGFSISMFIGGLLVWSVFIDLWRSRRRK